MTPPVHNDFLGKPSNPSILPVFTLLFLQDLPVSLKKEKKRRANIALKLSKMDGAYDLFKFLIFLGKMKLGLV